MTLITCPECRRSVSDRAAACPQCGYPINPEAGEPVLRAHLRRRATAAMVVGAVFFIIGMSGLIMGLVSSRRQPEALFFALSGLFFFAIGWIRRDRYDV